MSESKITKKINKQCKYLIIAKLHKKLFEKNIFANQNHNFKILGKSLLLCGAKKSLRLILSH